MKNLFGTMTLAALVLIGTAGCKKNEASAQGSAEPAAAGTTEGTALSDDARRAIETVLGTYEQVRADLAADRIDDAVRAAGRIEAAAREASGKAPARLRPHLDRLTAAAASLKSAPADRPDEVRRLFGEVSRPVVALLAADPSLAGGRYVFECPMAQGYKKWVQASADVSNPYMGTRMPRCGSESRWEP